MVFSTSRDASSVPYVDHNCQRNYRSLGLQTTGVGTAVSALVPQCMPKSTNTFMNFRHLCQRKMPSPSGGDGRRSLFTPCPTCIDLVAAPASQAYVERVFSVCGWLTAGCRNRLSKNLEIRVFLKMNNFRLGVNVTV